VSRARVIAASLITAFVAATTAPAVAQPVDPYAPLDGDAKPPPPPAVGDKDPAIAEAVAAALVVRARELIAADQWQDAQTLLGEALVESPDGAAGSEARALLDEVNRHLGIGGTVTDPYGDIGDPIDGPSDPYADQQYDPEVPPLPMGPASGGKRFFWHTALLGGITGGFFADAATADTNMDGVDDESSGAIVAGVIVGGLAGAGIGVAFRKNKWLTRADVVTVDSFAALGLIGSLEFTALIDPAVPEAYSASAVVGTLGGAITGLIMAKRHDWSARRMTRVDLFAGAGAAIPWLIFAAADGDSDDAQVAGFFSLGAMIGGAWLGFRTTRKMDELSIKDSASTIADAPTGVVQRDSDGAWHAGSLSLRPAGTRELGPALGKGGVVDLVGVAF
jgi:hypothetical protein